MPLAIRQYSSALISEFLPNLRRISCFSCSSGVPASLPIVSIPIALKCRVIRLPTMNILSIGSVHSVSDSLSRDRTRMPDLFFLA
ncbi:hypothetical protein D3C80_2028830 [compost metagenome]